MVGMLNNRLVFFILFFLILSSCRKNEPWEYASIRSENGEHDFAKIFYPPSNELDGIQFEIVRTGEIIHGYLSVTHFEIPPYKKNNEQALVTLISDHGEQSFITTRFQGGQKLKLSSACLEALVSGLKTSPTLVIKTGHFSQKIDSAFFTSYYQMLEKKTARYLPENLITFEFN